MLHASSVSVISPAATTVSGRVADDALGQLRTRYEIRQVEAVDAFLHAFPATAPLLLAAADVLPRYFGPNAPLAIDMFADPEDDDPRPELFVLVQTALPPDQAVATLDRLGEEWWFPRSPAPPATVVIDVEFV